MPRDGLQQYHVPAGTDGVTNFTIESTKYNAYIHDVEQDLNLPRPIAAGGTGASNAGDALVNLSGEKAAQVVTNWDSMLWMPGSFYAATTASGIAPVAGHAFSGICYLNEPLANPPTNKNLVLEATDSTDVSDTTLIPKYTRVMTAGVWGPWTKANSSVSPTATLGEYTFDGGIIFPPASGQIRFNNATQNSTTEIFISHLGVSGVDNTGLIGFGLKSGYDFFIQDKDESNKWKMFTATADPVLSGGDFRVTAIFKSAGVDLVSGQRMLLGANAGVSATTYAVRYDLAQTLTTPQQIQARQNIFAAPFDAMAYNGMQMNGGMELSQENGVAAYNFTAGATTVYKNLLDGVALYYRGAAFAGYAQQGDVKGSLGNIFPGTTKTLVIVITGGAALGANDELSVVMPLEGTRIARLNFGTAAAQPVSIGFWFNTGQAGTYSGSLKNYANNRSYPFKFTVAANTSTWISLSGANAIPGCTDGVWNTDNSGGWYLTLNIAGGSGRVGPPNAWAAADYSGAVGSINGVGAPTSYYISNVIVLPGTELPPALRAPFILRPFDQELQLAKRYWELCTVAWSGNVVATGWYNTCAYFDPEKRSTPTITSSSQSAGSTNGLMNARNVSIVNARICVWGATAASTGNAGGFLDTFIADARL